MTRMFSVGMPNAVAISSAVLWTHQNRHDTLDVGDSGFGRVGDSHQRRRIVRLFERIGNHEGERLALMVHTIVLEYVQALTDSRVWGALVRAISKPRRVAVRHGGDDTGRSFRCRTVDGCNAAIGDRTPHDGAVRQTWYVELGSVRGAARDLLAAVDAADWLSDNCGGHARA